MSDNRISYHYEAESREIIVTRGENESMKRNGEGLQLSA